MDLKTLQIMNDSIHTTLGWSEGIELQSLQSGFNKSTVDMLTQRLHTTIMSNMDNPQVWTFRSSQIEMALTMRKDRSIAISKVAFAQARQGHCTALIEHIDNQSNVYRIPYIEFLNVVTPDLLNCLLKNRFMNRPGHFSAYEGEQLTTKDWYRVTPWGLHK